MQFHLFIYATVGRRHELEAGWGGSRGNDRSISAEIGEGMDHTRRIP